MYVDFFILNNFLPSYEIIIIKELAEGFYDR